MSNPSTARARWRTLLTLAWPIVLARASQAVIGFCDALMVTPLGEEPLAAVTTGAMNTIAILVLPIGIVFILQSFAAQLRGRGRLEDVRRYGLYGLVIAAGFGAIAAAGIPLIRPVLGLLDYEPGVRDAMATYLAIRVLSVAAATGVEALGNWYGGLGNTRIALYAGILAMVANVAGNWLLIEPRLGLPGYGVAGAAWASTIASWLGFGYVAFAFWRGIGAEDVPRGKTKLSLAELGRVLRFGLPNGVNWFLEFAAFALFINVTIGHLGTRVLAAFNVVMQVNSLSFMPALGIASAGAILAGEAIGRRAPDEVTPILKLTAGCAIAWMVSVGIVYFVAPHAIASLFRPPGPNGAALVGTAALMLSIAVFWQLFDALALTVSETLRAAGDTAWSMWARIVLAWVVFTPLATSAVFLFGGGVRTVMVSLVIYMAALAGVLTWRYRTGAWRRIDMVGKEAELV